VLGRRLGGGTGRRRAALVLAATIAGCAGVLVTAPTLPAGEATDEVRGAGCSPGEAVVVAQDRVTVATGHADEAGRFAFEVDLDESSGDERRTLTVSCGAVEVVVSLRVGASSNPPWGIAGVAVALVLFAASAVAIVRHRAERTRRSEVS
jgi:hypothetical protein